MLRPHSSPLGKLNSSCAAGNHSACSLSMSFTIFCFTNLSSLNSCVAKISRVAFKLPDAMGSKPVAALLSARYRELGLLSVGSGHGWAWDAHRTSIHLCPCGLKLWGGTSGSSLLYFPESFNFCPREAHWWIYGIQYGFLTF